MAAPSMRCTIANRLLAFAWLDPDAAASLRDQPCEMRTTSFKWMCGSPRTALADASSASAVSLAARSMASSNTGSASGRSRVEPLAIKLDQLGDPLAQRKSLVESLVGFDCGRCACCFRDAFRGYSRARLATLNSRFRHPDTLPTRFRVRLSMAYPVGNWPLNGTRCRVPWWEPWPPTFHILSHYVDSRP